MSKARIWTIIILKRLLSLFRQSLIGLLGVGFCYWLHLSESSRSSELLRVIEDRLEKLEVKQQPNYQPVLLKFGREIESVDNRLELQQMVVDQIMIRLENIEKDKHGRPDR